MGKYVAPDFSNIPSSLDVTLYGNMEKVSDTLSKCRVRIFYKGMNRNRTFISEDFANQLISSLPYTPVKGIFDKDAVDFQDHGDDNTDGRIYGIVMAEPNFAWEDHMDEDGQIRTYACADVLLFTGLYPEAKLILGESQSMEIFRSSLKGEWRICEQDNQPYFHFLNGCLVGLQVLGEETEPCFEGSAFFSRLSQDDITDLKALAAYVKKYSIQEGIKMEELETQSTQEVAVEATPETVTETTFEEAPVIEEAPVVEETPAAEVTAVEDVQQVEEVQSVEEVIETPKVEETPVVEEVTEEVIVEEPVNQEFEDLKKQVNELTEAVAKLAGEKAAFEAEKAQMNEKISSLEAEKVEFEKQIDDFKSENESLSAFKQKVETEEKEKILAKYEEHLSEETATELHSKINEYSVEDFKKEVCTAAVESDSSIFAKKDLEPRIFYKGGDAEESSNKTESAVVRLLNKHKNGGNK